MMTVFVFCAVCLLPMMAMRDFTPSNELRYLSIADEAIANGHLFAFYNHGIPYADKPPLYFWIVMLCRLLFGHHSCLALSMFSLIPAFAIVGIMDRWVMKGKSAMNRMSVAGMTLTCVMFLGTMVVLRMDMLMCLFIVLALWTFYRMYTGEGSRRQDSLTLPLWIFLALFTKGPVGLLMPPLAIAVFLAVKRDWKGFRKYLGLKTWGIIAALSAVWLTCVWLEGGLEYINNLLFKQTVGRAVNAFTHARPFWFYLVTILWCLAPYTLLLIGSFMASLLPVRKAGAEKVSDLEILFLCTIISTAAMLSSFSSKLPIYLVPVLPFCVYLFPTVLDRIGERGWMRWSVGIFQILPLCAGIATLLFLSGSVTIPAAACLLDEYSFARKAPVVNAVILLTLANAMGTWFLIKRKSVNIPALLLSAGLFLAAFSASAVLRDLNPYIGYGSICSRVPEGTDVATIFLHRPENIDVYTGRQITDLGDDPAKLSEAVKAHIELTGKNVGSGRPLTIITRTSRMETTPELQKLFSEGTVIYAGPYCLTTISRK
uniref:ArnT family glycosyltransferase n=1 Tax=Candidatus Cryptobacteroides bacterium TaxID=3085639 RepID=UPI00402A3C5E